MHTHLGHSPLSLISSLLSLSSSLSRCICLYAVLLSMRHSNHDHASDSHLLSHDNLAGGPGREQGDTDWSSKPLYSKLVQSELGLVTPWEQYGFYLSTGECQWVQNQNTNNTHLFVCLMHSGIEQEEQSQLPTSTMPRPRLSLRQRQQPMLQFVRSSWLSTG